MRLGLLGGTFDPVHVGHLVAAAGARHALGLDRVLLVVANRPWQKEDRRPVTPAEDRFAMVAAAVEEADGLEACRLEIDRGGTSYTADTVAQLHVDDPHAELFLIVGADVAAELDTWVRREELYPALTLAVVSRASVPTPAPAPPWRSVIVETPRLEVSSSDLRRRVADGRPLDGLVPAAALRQLRRRGLYA
ncbi:MAG: nicotinate-nucleotide adenylyltransferase [Acidimicrobiales bacterium]